MSYSKRFDEFNATLIKIIEKLEGEDNPLSEILRSIYRRCEDREALYHAAWIFLYNESHRVIEIGCIENKKAAKIVLRIMNDIEEEMLYEEKEENI